MLEKINKDIRNFYHQNLSSFGSGAKGVGWKNEEAQTVRFAQLIKVIETPDGYSINDLGCGVGDLVAFLRSQTSHHFTYRGYDLLDDMIDRARNIYKNEEHCSFFHIKDTAEMQQADYVVASGIFNIRYAVSDAEWLAYILSTLEQLHQKSSGGFAFNALTVYSDKEYMQDYLYYADPLFLFDYCKKNFSKNVALLHDYNQYDFTIIVRKA
jgi:predicted TPR repeat methyltransferase